MLYPQQIWSVVGVQDFDNNGFQLLNPSIRVAGVSFSQNNMVSLSLRATENGGVFEHYASARYDNVDGLTDVDVIVNNAMADAFPTATVEPPLEQLRNA